MLKNINELEEKYQVKLDDVQLSALSSLINFIENGNPDMICLSGKPGSGKTTILKMLIDILNKNRISYTVAAPTNKAKLDRILACQNEIKGIAIERSTYKLYFKSNPQSKQYDNAMKQLFSWNQNPSVQNKQHDDFPDSLAGLITNVLGVNANVGRIKSFNGDKLGIIIHPPH